MTIPVRLPSIGGERAVTTSVARNRTPGSHPVSFRPTSWQMSSDTWRWDLKTLSESIKGGKMPRTVHVVILGLYVGDASYEHVVNSAGGLFRGD